MNTTRLLALVPLCLAAGLDGLVAQSVPSALPPAPTVPEETVELSPFIVNSSDDKGYRATNTLDGSRLNTALRDTPVAIGMFTRDLLDDLGVINVEDLMRYDVNAEDAQFGDDGYGAGVTQQGNMSDYGGAWRTRGLPASSSTNGFNTTGKFDLYNVESAGSTRGPNAILFGSGAAGGVLNLRTKAANTTRPSNDVEYKAGDDSLRRVNVDFNRVLRPNQLAFRAMGVAETRGHPMPHKRSTKESVTLATTYRLRKGTSLNVSWENSRVDGFGGRPFNPIDSISLFQQEVAAGRVVWSQARERYETLNGAVVGATAGAGNLAPRTVIVQGLDLYSPVLWEGTTSGANRTTLSTTASRFNGTKPIVNESIARYGSVTAAGDSEYGVVKFKNVTAVLNHSWTDRFHMEIAFNKSIRDSDGNIGSSSSDIRADLNYRLPDNSLNPYFYGNGYYFVNATFIRQTQGYDDTTWRASFSYEAGKADRWWGLHRFAALGERHVNNNSSYRTRQVWAGAPFGGTPESAANQVNWRRYFRIDGPKADYTTGYNPAGPFTTSSFPSVNLAGRTLRTAWVANNNLNYDDEITTDSGLVVMQNFLFHRRLVLTTGLRRDTIDTTSPNTVRDVTTQEWRYATAADQPSFAATGGKWIETTHEKGGRESIGAVFHLTSNFSLLANASNGVGINRRNRTVLPEQRVPDASKGKGEDFGLNFSFFENRLAGSIKRYQSRSIQEGGQGMVDTVFVNVNNDIMASFDYYLRAAGVTTFSSSDPIRSIDELRTTLFSGANGYLSDQESHGYEFETIANLAPNWTLRATYSYTDRSRTNVLEEGVGWWADRVALWKKLDALYIARTGRASIYNQLVFSRTDAFTNQTVADRIQDSDRELAAVRFREQQGYGNRKHKANLWTRYSIPSGLLKGLTLGGGWRYQSANLAGINLVTRELYYGNPRSLFDGMLSYTTRGFFGSSTDRLRVTYQFNVTNLLDNRTINWITIGNDSVTNAPYPRLAVREDPRCSVLTMRMAF